MPKSTTPRRTAPSSRASGGKSAQRSREHFSTTPSRRSFALRALSSGRVSPGCAALPREPAGLPGGIEHRVVIVVVVLAQAQDVAFAQGIDGLDDLEEVVGIVVGGDGHARRALADEPRRAAQGLGLEALDVHL